LAAARVAQPCPGNPREAWDKFAGRDQVRETLREAQDGYCAYCECRLASCHIDHHRPKSKNPALTFAWDNLHLSCDEGDSCGKHKGSCDNPELLDPYRDPTDAWLVYGSNGRVEPREGLPADVRARVESSIRDLGLNVNRLQRRRKEVMGAWQKQIALLLAFPGAMTAFRREEAARPFPSARAQAESRI
jgi:uncharacterized protein (TIGR02646 family)